jgi:hypothetical protein
MARLGAWQELAALVRQPTRSPLRGEGGEVLVCWVQGQLAQQALAQQVWVAQVEAVGSMATRPGAPVRAVVFMGVVLVDWCTPVLRPQRQ